MAPEWARVPTNPLKSIKDQIFPTLAREKIGGSSVFPTTCTTACQNSRAGRLHRESYCNYPRRELYLPKNWRELCPSGNLQNSLPKLGRYLQILLAHTHCLVVQRWHAVGVFNSRWMLYCQCKENLQKAYISFKSYSRLYIHAGPLSLLEKSYLADDMAAGIPFCLKKNLG